MSSKSRRRRLWKKSPVCRWCSRKIGLSDATLDHLIAKADGGSGKQDNIVLACKKCNNTRSSAKALREHIATLEVKKLRVLLHFLGSNEWQQPERSKAYAKIEKIHTRILELKEIIVRFHPNQPLGVQ